MIAHWDEVERERNDRGPLASWYMDLGEAAGTRDVGVGRWQIDPGKRSTPVHIELDEEEIFFVLGGSGLSWQDGETYEVRAGHCIVHRVGGETHTLVAGPEGLDVLAFGERTNPTATFLPRARVLRMGVTVDVSPGPHPWQREADAGELDVPEPSGSRANVVHVDDVEGDYGGLWKGLGAAGGAVRTGLNWAHLPPGEEGAPPHCHSAEEEIFVILDGEGILELWPSPQQARHGREYEEIPIRAGHVVSRPAGTGVAHGIRTTDSTMTYLAYGTRDRKDVAYYPRSNKIFFRGVGVIARLEDLDYSDGEPG